MSSESLLATFFINGFCFGVNALDVQEVLRQQPMTPVRLASAEVRGLINLRGQIVTAIDLRRRLGLEDRPELLPRMNVVVKTDDGPVSLLVDAIGDVIEVDDERLEPPPETLSIAERSLMVGIHKLDEKLLVVLDVERVVTPMGAAA